VNPRVLTLLLLLLAPAARADKQTEAAESFARGKALFAKNEYTAAVAAFERAYALRPHHAVQCSIALCYERMNRFVEAATHYRRCLEEGAKDTPKAKQVQKSLKGVEARMSFIEVKSPGAGGTVHVDGEALGPAPRRVPLDPGRHVIEVRREGARPASMTLRLLGGEERAVELTPKEIKLEPAPLPPPPPPKTPVEPPRRGLRTVWFWTAVALTGALGVAAGVMGGLTYKAHGDYDDAPTKQGYDTFVERRLITNILAGGAVAAGLTGTVLFFYTDFGSRERTDDDVALIGIRGTF
jgi:tetratricopeptide (TPR) repeat protein